MPIIIGPGIAHILPTLISYSLIQWDRHQLDRTTAASKLPKLVVPPAPGLPVALDPTPSNRAKDNPHKQLRSRNQSRHGLVLSRAIAELAAVPVPTPAVRPSSRGQRAGVCGSGVELHKGLRRVYPNGARLIGPRAVAKLTEDVPPPAPGGSVRRQAARVCDPEGERDKSFATLDLRGERVILSRAVAQAAVRVPSPAPGPAGPIQRACMGTTNIDRYELFIGGHETWLERVVLRAVSQLSGEVRSPTPGSPRCVEAASRAAASAQGAKDDPAGDRYRRRAGFRVTRTQRARTIRAPAKGGSGGSEAAGVIRTQAQRNESRCSRDTNSSRRIPRCAVAELAELVPPTAEGSLARADPAAVVNT